MEEVQVSDEELAEYLKDKSAVLFDSSSACRNAVSDILKELGLPSPNVIQVGKWEFATRAIEEHKPQIVITEYQVGDHFGLKLFPIHKENHPMATDRVFIVGTNTASESAVAEAAEEDVDSYIVKPYIKDVLHKYIRRTLASKVKPPLYIERIEQGKQFLAEQDFGAAKKLFFEAAVISDKPSLAFYYLGRADIFQSDLDEALGSFEQGLEVNHIHYKCLTGKFEVLDTQKNLKEAYVVMNQITKFYPVTLQQLKRMFYLAVVTKNFTDVEKYYAIFHEFEHKPEELRRVVSAGLIACGKFLIQKREIDRGFKLLHDAVICSHHNLDLIGKLVRYLSEQSYNKKAYEMLLTFPQQQKGEALFKQLDFLVFRASNKEDEVLNKGMQLVKEKVADATIFEFVVTTLRKRGNTKAADQIAHEAMQKFPELKKLVA